MGGRGTLVGYPFRAFGGERWRWATRSGGSTCRRPPSRSAPSPAPDAPSSWPRSLAPAGANEPFRAHPGPRAARCGPTVGLATEWFMGLIRLEGGMGLDDGEFEVTLDITREWWNIL